MQCLGTCIIRGGREQPQATAGPSRPTSKWSGRDVGRVIDEGSDGEEGKRAVQTLAASCPLPFILTLTNMHVQASNNNNSLLSCTPQRDINDIREDDNIDIDNININNTNTNFNNTNFNTIDNNNANNCYAWTLRKWYACSMYGYGSVGKRVPILEPLTLTDPPTWNL